MLDADRFRLLGKYCMPRVRVGAFVRCLIRGEVEVVGFRDGPIPWPVCKTARRPAPAVDPSWPAWNSGAVAKLAAAINEGRRFADLPILADALEESGCADAAILAHCRGGGEHVRGCWVVDLLTGRQ